MKLILTVDEFRDLTRPPQLTLAPQSFDLAAPEPRACERLEKIEHAIKDGETELSDLREELKEARSIVEANRVVDGVVKDVEELQTILENLPACRVDSKQAQWNKILQRAVRALANRVGA